MGRFNKEEVEMKKLAELIEEHKYMGGGLDMCRTPSSRMARLIFEAGYRKVV